MSIPNSDLWKENDRNREILDSIFEALKREMMEAIFEPEKEDEKEPTPLKLVA